MRGRWHTPDAPSSGFICRTVRIPNSELCVAIVNGALDDLTKSFNFEEVGALTAEQTAALFQVMYDDYNIQRGCLIGTIFAHASSTAPAGSLACDGATYNRSDYPDLFDSLDAAYRIGSTQFFTPDLRGRTLVGSGTGTGLTNRAFASQFGAESVSLTQPNLANHAHTHNTAIVVGVLAAPGVVPASLVTVVPQNTGATGSGTAHENMQPSLALHYAIWAQ